VHLIIQSFSTLGAGVALLLCTLLLRVCTSCFASGGSRALAGVLLRFNLVLCYNALMVYSVEDIRARVIPLAKKYGLKSVLLFGSYARGEATGASDVDLLVDSDGCPLQGFSYFGMSEALKAALAPTTADIVDRKALESVRNRKHYPYFEQKVLREAQSLYERS
jgi:predicted nucleotidyltransferase